MNLNLPFFYHALHKKLNTWIYVRQVYNSSTVAQGPVLAPPPVQDTSYRTKVHQTPFF